MSIDTAKLKMQELEAQQASAQGAAVQVHTGPAAQPGRRRQNRLLSPERAAAVLSPILFVLLWQLLVGGKILDHRFFPPPWLVVKALLTLARNGRLWSDLSITLYRVGLGFVIGALAGMALGLVMGVLPLLRAFLDPVISGLYVIPKIAILPLVMLVVGIGEASKVVIVAIAVFFIVVINTAAAVLEIEPMYIDAGRNFGARRLQMFRHVVLPGALPAIFTGLRLAAGTSLIMIIAAEFVTAKRGVGYLIWQSWNTLVVENMFAGLVVVALLGVAFTVAITLAARLAMPWHRQHGRRR